MSHPMTIHMRCVYETGALFAADPGSLSTQYLPVEKEWERKETYNETNAVK
jgi:hypothetical protein